MQPFSIRSALSSAFRIQTRPSMSINVCQRGATTGLVSASNTQTSASFSTAAMHSANKGKGKGAKPDKRITLIRYFLHHPTTLMPRPLRFSRNRFLRHWTIHRAWQLFRANLKKQRQLQLERQYNAMREANEELRVGAGDGGVLFRKSQMKTGVWSIPERGGGIPIEYSRGMVDWVGTKGLMGANAKIWDSEWKRM